MNLILLGAPGSGKGTLANSIQKDFGILNLSTGDLLRESVRNGEELGKIAKDFMNRGELVPNHLIINLVKSRILKEDAKLGVMFDGFPRTTIQAEALSKLIDIDVVIHLKVSKELIEKRLTQRRTCAGCGAIYNTSFYNKNTCEKCNAPLFQRDDDKLESIRNRLEVYDKETPQLIDFYKDRIFEVVGGDFSPDITYQSVKKLLTDLRRKYGI